MRAWTTSINGERLFLKGANQGPTRMQLADATAEDLARDVDLAPAAHPALLRIHGHISRPQPYSAADGRGPPTRQDLPPRCGDPIRIRNKPAPPRTSTQTPPGPPPL